MKTKFITAAIALSVVAGSLAVPATASAASMIRTKPVETTQKAQNVHYYGYYGHRRHHYRYYYQPRYYGYYGYGY